MDAPAAVIAFLFFITIITSVNNKPLGKPAFMPAAALTLEAPLPVYGSAESYSVIERYVLKYRRAEEAEEIARSIVEQAKKQDVNPKLVAALMARESRFNPRAVSASGAVGLGQLLPSTCKNLGVDNPYDIPQNVAGSVRYLKYLLGRFGKYEKQVLLALGAYLEGPNIVERQAGFTKATHDYVEDIINIYYKM